jgi:hypothetical protein
MLNLYVPINSNTLTAFQGSSPYANEKLTWTNSPSNDYFYNTQYNIYVYPVANVAAAREANGD